MRRLILVLAVPALAAAAPRLRRWWARRSNTRVVRVRP